MKMNKNKTKGKEMIDQLTGASYSKEKAMYMRYHGLSEKEAELVMGQTTYQTRDDMLNQIIEDRKNNG